MTKSDKSVVVGGDVQGNITSCKIENQLLSSHRNSAFSIVETNTYISYDVCNRQELARYTNPEITAFSVLLLFALGVTFVIWRLTRSFY